MTDDRQENETDKPDFSTENQQPGDARRPGDHLDKDRESTETIPRKSSLLGD